MPIIVSGQALQGMKGCKLTNIMAMADQLYRVTVLVLLLCMIPITTFAEAPQITAKHVGYDHSGKVLTANGDVHYRTDQDELTAGQLLYDTRTHIVVAREKVTVLLQDFDKPGQIGHLIADELEYDRSRKLVTARGHVVLTFDKAEYRGDQCIYDRSRRELILNGNVRLQTKQGDVIYGSAGHYYLDHEAGDVANFKAEFIVDNVHYYSNGQKLSFDGNHVVICQAMVTSCDASDKPHFYYRVEQADYRYDQKLVLNHAAYYDHGRKWFECEQLVIPLHGNEPVLPSVGYSAEEGWFVKTKQFYDLRGHDYGVIYKDWLSLKGWGLGFREYHFGTDGSENQFYLYRSRKFGTPNETIKGEVLNNGGGNSQMLSFRREDNRYRGQGSLLQAAYDFSGRHGKSLANAQLDYQLQTGSGGYSQFNSNLSEDYRNNDKLRTFYSFYLTRNKFGSSELLQDRQYSLSMEYTDPLYFSQLYILENKYGLDYQPRLMLQTSLPSSPVQYEVVTNRITRNYDNFSVQQTDVKAAYNSQPQKISHRSFLSTSATVARTSYSNGDHLTNWTATTNVLTNMNAKLYTNTAVTVGHAGGYNPVDRLDTTADTKTVTYDMNYRFDENYRFVVGGGYDAQLHRQTPYTLSLDGRTYPLWNWNLNTTYDPSLHMWKTAGLYLTLNPDSQLMGFINLNYDAQLRSLSQVSLRLEGKLYQTWGVRVRSDYDALNSSMTAAEISLTRDLHCRQFTISIYPHDHLIFMQLDMKNAGSS